MATNTSRKFHAVLLGILHRVAELVALVLFLSVPSLVVVWCYHMFNLLY
jgi:hypothetical protein